MIEIKNLNKSFKSFKALKDINLTVEKGELFAYLGPNGAGKTTTIKIITGLTKYSSGKVYLNGYDVEKKGLFAKEQCGVVPQSINLDQELTVFENLDIHGRLYKIPKKKRDSRINELLEYLEVADRKYSLAKQLSGGLKRRVMIARALVHSPKILFLDEPTVGLDAAIRKRIWAIIKRIQQDGSTIFLTTHYIEEAEYLAQRVAFLNEGEIVEVNTPKNLVAKMGSWAVDRVVDNQLETSYYNKREDASVYIGTQNTDCMLRRVNLEDSFLSLTGKKVK
jgi:ABC-2 type transport system ATP-binding protein